MLICPAGFYPIPDNEMDRYIKWGTNNCTAGCRTPNLTAEEFRYHDSVTRICGCVGFANLFLLLMVIACGKKKRNHYLIYCISIFSGLGSLLSVIVLDVQSPNKTFCETDIQPQTNAHGVNLCAVQGALNLYFLLACCFSWVLQALELYLQVVYNKSIAAYWRLNVCLVVVLPLSSLTVNAIFGRFGYGGWASWCFVAASEHETIVTLAVYYIPVFLSVIWVIVSMCAVLYKLIIAVSHLFRLGEARFECRMSSIIRFTWILLDEANKYLSTSMLFLACIVAGFTPVFVYGGQYMLNEAEYQASWTTWVTCVFANFDGISDASWQRECGTHPAKRPDVFVSLIVLSCQSIMVSVVFFPYLRLARKFCGYATRAVKWGLRCLRRVSSKQGFQKVVVDSEGDEENSGHELIGPARPVAHGERNERGERGQRGASRGRGVDAREDGGIDEESPEGLLGVLPVSRRVVGVGAPGGVGGQQRSGDVGAKEGYDTGTNTTTPAGTSFSVQSQSRLGSASREYHSRHFMIISPSRPISSGAGHLPSGVGDANHNDASDADAGDAGWGRGRGRLSEAGGGGDPHRGHDSPPDSAQQVINSRSLPGSSLTTSVGSTPLAPSPVASRFWPIGGPGPETGHGGGHGRSRLRSESYYMESVGEHASLYEA